MQKVTFSTQSDEFQFPEIHKNVSLTESNPISSRKSPKNEKGLKFSQAERFQEKHGGIYEVGPGDYHNESSMISSNLGTKIGLGKKVPVIFPHLIKNPGPGYYEMVDLNNLKQGIIRGVKFSKSKHETFEEILKQYSGPSPCEYNIDITSFKKKRKKLRGGTFGLGDRYNYIKYDFPFLGPGAYNIIEDFILQKKMNMGEKLGESKAAILKQKRLRKLPGPGAYDFPNISPKRNITFGSGKRSEIFVSKSVSPGPAAYYF